MARPDPALTDPQRAGLRAHRHPPDRLHGWLFLQPYPRADLDEPPA